MIKIMVRITTVLFLITFNSIITNLKLLIINEFN